MKISKLFHLLYAVVMLLPIFAIGVTCGYAMFNKNAYQNYSGEETIETTYVHSSNNFVVNKKYTLNVRNFNDLTNVSNLGSQYRISFDNVTNINTNITNTYDLSDLSSVGFYKLSNTSLNVYLFDSLNNSIITFSTNNNFLSFDFYYLSSNLDSTLLENTNLFYSESNLQGHYIDNVFYYSVDKVTQSNLFSWAYDSFLVTPFTYIVSLFSMPSNSPVVMLLSYWLSISIIWLVFDLVMYIPLLVHRWLDKGVLE